VPLGEQGCDERPERIGDQGFTHPPRLTVSGQSREVRYALLLRRRRFIVGPHDRGQAGVDETVIGSPWFSPAMRWTAVNAIEDDLGSPEPYAVDLAVEEVDQGGDRLRLVRSAPPRAPYWPPAFLAVAGRVAALALLKGLARPAMRQATGQQICRQILGHRRLLRRHTTRRGARAADPDKLRVRADHLSGDVNVVKVNGSIVAPQNVPASAPARRYRPR
jgi:hypothetical protein